MAESVDWLEFKGQISVSFKSYPRRKPIGQKQFLHPDPQKLTVMVQTKLVKRNAPTTPVDTDWWEQD